jgi:hypothetical protein
MLNEVTGVTGPVPAGFEMRAVTSSLTTNSTIHVTPYTEMAAYAAVTSGAWTTNAAATINTANAVVRTGLLPGLDPLTTSPVVVSSAPTSEQAASQQMAVALAAVVQASNAGIGTTDCSVVAAADRIKCAVNALSGTVATIDSANNTATINAFNVMALSSVNLLTTVHVPTTGGTPILLNTVTDPGAMTLKTWMNNNISALTANADPVTGQAPVNLPSTTVLNGVTQAKAFVSDLRTNVHLFSNNSKTGLLDQQTARFKTDMAGNIAPNVSNAGEVVQVMGEGTDLLANAALPNTFNCTRNTNGTVTCWADTTNNPFFMNFPGMVRTTTKLTLTSTSVNAASYAATAWQCTVDINYVCSTPVVDASKASGSGTISRTVDTLGNATSAALNGTLPGSNGGIVRDSIALNASGLNTGGNTGRIDLSGSIKGYGGTPSAVDATPSASLLLDTGTYLA